jgi:hypothetical protein
LVVVVRQMALGACFIDLETRKKRFYDTLL